MADADGAGRSYGPGLCCRCAAWRSRSHGEAVRQTGLLRCGDPRDRIPAECCAAGCIGQGELCRAVVRCELVAVGRPLDSLCTWRAGKDRSRRSCGCGAPTAGCKQKADQRYKQELISRQDGTTLPRRSAQRQIERKETLRLISGSSCCDPIFESSVCEESILLMN